MINLGNTFERLGRYAEAGDRNSAARKLCRELGDESGESIVESNLGLVRQRVGDYKGARWCVTGTRELCRKIGDRAGRDQR